MPLFFFDTKCCPRKGISPICPNFNFIIKGKKKLGLGFTGLDVSLFLWNRVLPKKKWD